MMMHLVFCRTIMSVRLSLSAGVKGINLIRNGGFNRSLSSYCSSCTGSQQQFPQGMLRNQMKLPLESLLCVRKFSSSTGGSESGEKKSLEGEMQLKTTINKAFPNATKVVVEDISGGCGSMYQIYIEAPDFKGLSTVKQHLLVNQALKQEIKNMHGIRIQTGVPP
ncbi:unnamed protein product [Orchesella dallaii]|uniref:BolA-like protein 3 n=1 Tax=Orchesella dallaii TaxID=48710 RepID=A0ABP1QBU8_9HEXA